MHDFAVVSYLVRAVDDQARKHGADRVLAGGAAGAVRINTGGNCHLEAAMVDQALDRLDLSELDLVLIEYVGNLVCPTHWQLGEGLKVCLASVAEGDDKPVKYPDIFAAADAIVLNKIDLATLVDFDRGFFDRSVRALNPDAPVFDVLCRTGTGIDPWAGCLLARRTEMRLGAGQAVAG